MQSFIYTITAGRTGTAWLAALIRDNLPFKAVHEQLGIDDFGSRMPDIRTMRRFNERGLTAEVEAFWREKFDGLRGEPRYAETNHTLAKCGLVDYAAKADADADAAFTFVAVRRDTVDLCLSFLHRHDFSNVTIVWQWYLDTAYARRIVEPAPYLALGPIGSLLWYAAEVEARQIYYAKLYADRFRFVFTDTEAMTTPEGAAGLLAALGRTGVAPPSLPPRMNANPGRANPAVRAQLAEVVARTRQPLEEIVSDYLASGRRLAGTGSPARGSSLAGQLRTSR